MGQNQWEVWSPGYGVLCVCSYLAYVCTTLCTRYFCDLLCVEKTWSQISNSAERKTRQESTWGRIFLSNLLRFLQVPLDMQGRQVSSKSHCWGLWGHRKEVKLTQRSVHGLATAFLVSRTNYLMGEKGAGSYFESVWWYSPLLRKPWQCCVAKMLRLCLQLEPSYMRVLNLLSLRTLFSQSWSPVHGTVPSLETSAQRCSGMCLLGDSTSRWQWQSATPLAKYLWQQ